MTVLDFRSDHFTLEELADGVYAAIHKPGGGAFSNGGLIDLGDKVLVFDTFDNPLPAQDLLRASRELIGRDPEFVVISHWHGDHWGGIQAFTDSAQIISTEVTRNLILERSAPGIEQLINDPSPIDNQISETDQAYKNEEDPEQKVNLKSSLSSLKYRRKAMDIRKIAVPDETFESEMEFIGSNRRVLLHCPGGGHTDSDSIIYLPEEKIAFIADLGFFYVHPFLGTGHPDELVRILTDLENSEYEVFVPGHGAVGSLEEVSAVKQYVLSLAELVKEHIRKGDSADQVAELPIPAPFDPWASQGRYSSNMRFLYEQYS